MRQILTVACSLIVGVLIGFVAASAIRLAPTQTASHAAQYEPSLLHAVWNGDIEQLDRYLDEANIGVDAPLDQEGRSALMIACQLGFHLEVIEHLLSKGASVSAKAKNGNTAIHFAVNSGDLESVEAILKLVSAAPGESQRDEWTPLHEAASGSSASIVTALVNAGYDVNASGPDGLTPLMAAAGQGSREVVETLVKAGANLQSTNKYGNTAMDFAKKRASRKTMPHVTDVTDLLQ